MRPEGRRSVVVISEDLCVRRYGCLFVVVVVSFEAEVEIDIAVVIGFELPFLAMPVPTAGQCTNKVALKRQAGASERPVQGRRHPASLANPPTAPLL